MISISAAMRLGCAKTTPIRFYFMLDTKSCAMGAVLFGLGYAPMSELEAAVKLRRIYPRLCGPPIPTLPGAEDSTMGDCLLGQIIVAHDIREFSREQIIAALEEAGL